MLNPIFSSIVYLTELLICYFFFSVAAQRRYSAFLVFLLGVFLFGLGSAGNLLSANDPALNTFVTILIQALFARICFQIKLHIGAFYSVVLMVIGSAMEYLALASTAILSGSDFFDYNKNLSILLLVFSISKLLYFLAVLLLTKLLPSKGQTGSLPVSLLLYPVTGIVCFLIFWYICADPGTSYAIQSLLSIASTVLLMSTILLFITYQHQVERDRRMIQMQSELAQLENEKTYYDILEQQNQELMAYAHDAKNHLEAIRSLNADPRITDYVSSLSRQLSDYSRHCHSGNKMLDVMIHKFSAECKLRGFAFTYDVKLCNLEQVEDMDLVAILGNLMDNAVAAAEQSAAKTISLHTAIHNHYSILVVTNSCDTPPRSHGHTLITSKERPKHHGYGLRNVEKTLKKYQGDFAWEYDEACHIFTVTAMIGDTARPRMEKGQT